jgi:asparagine synthase (glutamine-hydrolysing)
MCGIAGVLSNEDADRTVQAMVLAMHHRGPDDQGQQNVVLHSRQIGLGNARLAIIDLSSAGHMPMVNPDTGDWITYNGEIYNFPELRNELEEKGCAFHSTSDTEVVLKAYQVWGPDCLLRLRGMFAFALWDAKHGELMLARDRVGEKPLYYYSDPARARFLFASELRTLLASGWVDRQLDPAALGIYLYNGFMVAPRTLVKGIVSLLPGHWMRLGLDGSILETRRYWHLPNYTGEEKPASQEQILEILGKAVRMRMVSDVPLGAFLSGGLDSSTIVGLMARTKSEVRTFSIGFNEASYDESSYARWVAKYFQTDHHSILLGPQDFSNWLEAGLAGMDQPTFDGLNTYFVSRAARENGLTVALSGLGGDELFGGYPFFRSAPLLARFAQAMRVLPANLKAALTARAGSTYGVRKAFHILGETVPPGLELLAAYQTSLSLIPRAAQSALLADAGPGTGVWFGLPLEFVDFLNAEGRDTDALSLLSKYILRLFEGERTLRDGDSLSMAVSLEVRTAFTDHPLIEALWTVPGRERCAGAPDKPYQARLARPILGETYPFRKKQGFTFPFQEWLQNGEMRQRLEDTLLDAARVRSAGLLPEGTAALAHSEAQVPWSRRWAIFVLLDWIQRNRLSL